MIPAELKTWAEREASKSASEFYHPGTFPNKWQAHYAEVQKRIEAALQVGIEHGKAEAFRDASDFTKNNLFYSLNLSRQEQQHRANLAKMMEGK